MSERSGPSPRRRRSSLRVYRLFSLVLLNQLPDSFQLIEQLFLQADCLTAVYLKFVGMSL